MLENVLARYNVSFKIRITVKSLVSAGIVALAVLLPQLVHLAFGQAGGVQWLPMYLPVLLGGCLLGTWWGLGVGVAAPLVSFAITSAMGNAMPAASRLPFMVAELAVFAAVSGLFSKKIAANGWMAFPARDNLFAPAQYERVPLEQSSRSLNVGHACPCQTKLSAPSRQRERQPPVKSIR